MRVLQVINNLDTGGAEKLLESTIPLFQDNGIEMDLLLLNGKEYPLLNKLRIKTKGQIFDLGNKSVYWPFYFLKLRKLFMAYDVVHVHLFPAQYQAALAKVLFGIKTPLIFTEHNTSNRRLKTPLLRFVDRQVYRIFSTIVCVSKQIKPIIQRHTGIESSKIICIENGIDVSLYQNALPIPKGKIHPNLTDEDILLIQVSGFRKQKDQVTLIKSMPHMYGKIKLLLVGVGALYGECEKLVKRLGLGERVFFLGQRSDVPNLLKASDIIVLSSHYEGLSLASLEAMASGKPLIASKVVGLTDVVQDAGILFEHQNHRDLAAKIMTLIEDPNYYKSVVKSCIQRANSYDISIMIRMYIKLYNACLSKNQK